MAKHGKKSSAHSKSKAKHKANKKDASGKSSAVKYISEESVVKNSKTVVADDIVKCEANEMDHAMGRKRPLNIATVRQNGVDVRSNSNSNGKHSHGEDTLVTTKCDKKKQKRKLSDLGGCVINEITTNSHSSGGKKRKIDQCDNGIFPSSKKTVVDNDSVKMKIEKNHTGVRKLDAGKCKNKNSLDKKLVSKSDASDKKDTKINSNSHSLVKTAEFKVGPTQTLTLNHDKDYTLVRRSRAGKKRRRKSSSNSKQQSSANISSTSASKVEKSQPYQRINKDCYVAVDCEMVGIGTGGTQSALGRCSIVDYDGGVLYDKYVKCREAITDYRTVHSGITPEHMETAEAFGKAKIEIHSLLKNKVVVAHSIGHDLKVLQLCPHRYLVRDTAKCHMLEGIAKRNGYEGADNALISLKALAKSILGKDIQVGTKGHNSVEDAQTAMELFRRVRNGWEKMLFAKWSNRESFNVSYVVNGLNDKQDVLDAKGIRITDYGSPQDGDDSVDGTNGSPQDGDDSVDGTNGSGDQEDFLSDDFWKSI